MSKNCLILFWKWKRICTTDMSLSFISAYTKKCGEFKFQCDFKIKFWFALNRSLLLNLKKQQKFPQKSDLIFPQKSQNSTWPWESLLTPGPHAHGEEHQTGDRIMWMPHQPQPHTRGLKILQVSQNLSDTVLTEHCKLNKRNKLYAAEQRHLTVVHVIVTVLCLCPYTDSCTYSS